VESLLPKSNITVTGTICWERNSNQNGKHEIGKIGNNAVTTEVRTARSLA
jgi:hypothetical protein